MKLAGKHRPPGNSSSSVAASVTRAVALIAVLALLLVGTPVGYLIWAAVTHV